MRIGIVDVHHPGDHKDFNGGFGTTFRVGDSILGKTLKRLRVSSEYIPLLNYGYIAAVLRTNGHTVQYFENRLPGNGEIDVAVLHGTLIRYHEELELLGQLRQLGAFTVVVGPFPSKCPEAFADHADLVIRDEAEPLLAKVHSLADLPRGTVSGGFVDELDALPFPDWSIYDYTKFKQYPVLRKPPTFLIQGSRSCPYKCTYCPYIVHDNSYRRRSPQNVIAEIEHVVSRYGARSILFRDPVFSLKRAWVVELCELLKQRPQQIEWACETRTDRLDRELLTLMHSAGMSALKIGVESSNHVALQEHERRPPEKAHQEAMVAYAESLGVRVVAFYVLGLPEDTPQTTEETIQYAQQLNTSFANFTICTPIPGTKFYDEVKSRIFDFNYNHYDNFHPVFKSDFMTSDEITHSHSQALIRFYFRLGFVKKQVAQLVGLSSLLGR